MQGRKPSVIFFDIETAPLLAYIWVLGEQVVRHHQLADSGNQTRIICISYAFNDWKPAQTIDWGYEAQDTGRVISAFDKIVKRADIAIGKNSDRFDVKHINAQRVIHDLPPLPEWTDYTDDLEKQLRRYFIFPSYSLDYISKTMGQGGKVKMEFQDWIDIVEKRSKRSFAKMLKYNRKDVEDTRALWNKLQPHIKPRLNMNTFINADDVVCIYCGSDNIEPTRERCKGTTRYMMYDCCDHKGYAGKMLLPSVRSGKITL